MISVVIPCLNEAAFIDATLAALAAQEDPGEPFEVVVADGGSTDGTRDLLQEWSERDPRFRWIDNPDRITPVAMNRGIRAARGETVVIFGAHARCDSDFLQRNAEALRAHPESGCVGGTVSQIHGTPTARRIGMALSTPFGVGDARFRTGGLAGHVDTVAFGAYRRAALEEIGLFDETLVRNQDDELNFRLLEAGWRIWFDPRIRSSYFVRSSYRRLWAQYRQYGYWKVFVNRKHGTVTTARQVVPALFLLLLAVLTVLAVADVAGVLPTVWHRLPVLMWASAAGLWGAGAVASAAIQADRIRDIPGTVWAFACIHGGYGGGYWEGILHFLLLRRKPAARASVLTR
jgi:glycosyltransferase involved in cell wall biosynthesis